MAIYTNKIFDITIIEINPIEYNLKLHDFLELDLKLEKEENYILAYFRGKSIYLLQYDVGENISVSYSLIKEITDDYRIKYFADTNMGSSGSPILNLRTQKIIGVHISNRRDKYAINTGILLNIPINEFINKNKDYLNSWSLHHNYNKNINKDKINNEK